MMSDIESGQYCWRTAGGFWGQANRTADCLGEQGGLATQPADTGKELNPVAPPVSSDILARFGPSRIAESSMEMSSCIVLRYLAGLGTTELDMVP